MTKEETLHCLKVYKKHLEDYEDSFAYVNETNIHTEKAVLVTLFCIDFEQKENEWSDLHKTCLIQFWSPRKLTWYNCSNGCNAKIPKWLAILNIQRCIEKETTNLCK